MPKIKDNWYYLRIISNRLSKTKIKPKINRNKKIHMSSHYYNQVIGDKTSCLHILSLPPEIQTRILLTLPYKDVINYCQTCKLTYPILNDQYFWKNKAALDFGLPKELFDYIGNPDKFSKEHSTDIPCVSLKVPSMTAFYKYRYLTKYYNKECFLGTVANLELYPIYTSRCIYNTIINHDAPLFKFFLDRITDFDIKEIKPLIMQFLIKKGDVRILKIIIEYFKFEEKDFNDFFELILTRMDKKFVSNPDNYNIIEYIIKNFTFQNQTYDYISLIIAMIKFSSSDLEEILVTGRNHIIQLLEK